MTSLQEARKKDHLDKFIAERDVDLPGDIGKLDATIGRSSQKKSKSNQEASTPDSGDD